MSNACVDSLKPTTSPICRRKGHLLATLKTALLIVLSQTAGLGQAASFDCAKAGTAVEKAICADKRLGRLDEVLAQNYRAMSAANIGGGALSNLRSTQRSWLAIRNQCADVNCIGKRYQERIDAVCEYPVLSGVFPSCTSSAEVEAEFKTQSAPPSAQKAPAAQPAPAVSSNAQKIKALGLPANFLDSTLYINYLGQWQPLMPCSQFLSKLLDNKKVASIESLSRSGNPGIAIKVAGRPAVGFLFRMESKEAYLHAFEYSGNTTVLRDPADHSSAAVAMQVFASGDIP